MNTDRYEAERLQGKLIASGKEDVWGWSGRAGTLRAARRADSSSPPRDLAPGVRCLELGCGTGEFTERLVESGCELVAVDLSEETAALARERVGDKARRSWSGTSRPAKDWKVSSSTRSSASASCTTSTSTRVRAHVPAAATRRTLRVQRAEHGEPTGLGGAQRRPRPQAPTRDAARDRVSHRRAARAVSRQRASSSTLCEPFEFLHPRTPAWLVPAALSIERGLEATPARGSPDRSGSPGTAPRGSGAAGSRAR